MMRRLQARQVGTHRTQLGESPRWDHYRQRLVYVDVYRGVIVSVHTDGEIDAVIDVGEPVGCVALTRTPGRYLCAVESGLITVGLEGDRRRHVWWRQEGFRLNDGRCDPAGRFWVGSMAHGGLDNDGHGVLYRWEPPHGLQSMLRGLRISNGMAWDIARGRMYFVDSALDRIDWFRWRDNEYPLGRPHELVTFPVGVGSPDGMAIDRAGRVWVAMWEGGQVLGIDSQGAVFTTASIPTPLVTACAFGGSDLRTLFITTAQGDWPDFATQGDDPLAGALYAVELPVSGVVERALHPLARPPDRTGAPSLKPQNESGFLK